MKRIDPLLHESPHDQEQRQHHHQSEEQAGDKGGQFGAAAEYFLQVAENRIKECRQDRRHDDGMEVGLEDLVTGGQQHRQQEEEEVMAVMGPEPPAGIRTTFRGGSRPGRSRPASGIAPFLLSHDIITIYWKEESITKIAQSLFCAAYIKNAWGNQLRHSNFPRQRRRRSRSLIDTIVQVFGF